jgi:hypothetical protein
MYEDLAGIPDMARDGEEKKASAEIAPPAPLA